MQHNLISLFSRNKAVSKILSCCAVFVFVFVCSAPVIFSSASAVSIQPQVPIFSPWQSGNLEYDYDSLTEEQKEIADTLIGSGAAQYGGLGNYWLRSGYSLSSEVTNWFEKLGQSFVGRAVISGGSNVVFEVTGALSDFIGSCIYKASTYLSKQDFVDDVNNSVHYYMEYIPGLSAAWSDYFGLYGNLENWQYTSSPFTSNFTWNTYSNVSSEVLSQYVSLVDALPDYQVHVNDSKEYTDVAAGIFYQRRYNIVASNFVRYDTNEPIGDLYLFLNPNTGRYSIVDGGVNGAAPDVSNGTPFKVLLTYIGVAYNNNFVASQVMSPTFQIGGYVTMSDYSTVLDAVRAIYNILYPSNTSNSTYQIPKDMLTQTVYVGTSWADKQQVADIDDLNIAVPTSTYIDDVERDIVIDLKGMIDDLSQSVTNLRDVVLDNAKVKDDISEVITRVLTPADAISSSTGNTTVPPNIFSDLFGRNNDGYIWYLWSMTKPLVLYTRDFLNTLLFNGKGIAWIVYGVVSVGLIGGLVVKFLL